MYAITIKRIYEQPETIDGYRMLVDKLWPRGIKKEAIAIDEWNKEIAPSVALRKWFGHRAERFEIFSEKYIDELLSKPQELRRIYSISKKQNVTLLYAAKDEKVNHARVLLSVLASISSA